MRENIRPNLLLEMTPEQQSEFLTLETGINFDQKKTLALWAKLALESKNTPKSSVELDVVINNENKGGNESLFGSHSSSVMEFIKKLRMGKQAYLDDLMGEYSQLPERDDGLSDDEATKTQEATKKTRSEDRDNALCINTQSRNK